MITYLTKLAIPDVHYFKCKTNSAKFGSLIMFENNYHSSSLHAELHFIRRFSDQIWNLKCSVKV